jgi:hypothetical protein
MFDRDELLKILQLQGFITIKHGRIPPLSPRGFFFNDQIEMWTHPSFLFHQKKIVLIYSYSLMLTSIHVNMKLSLFTSNRNKIISC